MKFQAKGIILSILLAQNAFAIDNCNTSNSNELNGCLTKQIENLKIANKELSNLINKIQNQIDFQSSQKIPAGTVIAFAGNEIPEGWLLCDGRYFLTSQYPNLYQAIGRIYGGYAGYFNIPDYRGVFLRGVSGQRSDQFADSDKLTRIGGDRVGSLQLDTASEINKNQSTNNNQQIPNDEFKNSFKLNSNNILLFNLVETRPKNVSVQYIIKY